MMKSKFFEIILLAVTVFIIGYAFGLNFLPIISSVVMAIISYWVSERFVPPQLKTGFLSHIAVGLSFGFSWGIYDNYFSTVASVSLAAFFMALSGRLDREGEEIDLKGSLTAGFTLGLSYAGAISGLATILSGFWYSIQLFAGIFIATLILTILGVIVGKFLKPRIKLYRQFLPYLSVMKDAAIAFAVGYLFIGTLFAVFYACDWRFSGGNTLKLPDEHSPATFFDFVYFSFVTIATVGYGDILPLSKVSRILVIAEVIVGIGWITVVFAAITAYLQKPFSEIILNHRQYQADISNNSQNTDTPLDLGNQKQTSSKV